MTKKQQTLWLFIIGTVLLLIVLGVVLIERNPSDTTFFVVRVVLALAAGSYASIIPGFIGIENGMIKAGGALGVTALVYLINPQVLHEHEEFLSVDGIVLLDGKPQSDVTVNALDIEQQRITNTFGKFPAFEVRKNDTPKEIKFRFSFHQNNVMLADVDTMIIYTAAMFSKPPLEFQLYSRHAALPTKILQGHVWTNNPEVPNQGVVVSAGGISDTTDNEGGFRIEVQSSENYIVVSFNKPGYISKMEQFSLPDQNISKSLQPVSH